MRRGGGLRKVILDSSVSSVWWRSADKDETCRNLSKTLLPSAESDFLENLKDGKYETCAALIKNEGEEAIFRNAKEIRQLLSQNIREMGNIPPLHFLYNVDKRRIFSFEQLIDSILCFKEMFLDAWKKEKDISVLILWMDRIISSQNILGDFITSIIDWLISEPTRCKDFLRIFNDETALEREDVKKFYSKMITALLTSCPSVKIAKAISEQENWRQAIVEAPEEELTRDLFIEILIPFENVGEITVLLKRILRRKEVDWKNALSLLALAHKYDKVDTEKETFELVTFFINIGFENQNFEFMITAFLLMRQICLPDTTNYNRWFEKTFSGNSSKTKNSRSNYEFFIDFLTKLVPFERAEYLRGHISKPPAAPNSSLRHTYSDYILLARTRLADIVDAKKQQEENIVFSEIPSEIVLEVDADIKNAIDSLKSSGKLPPKLIQASIFKKPYFNGYFLNRLLFSTDKTPETMQLVQALSKKGKLSKNMLASYEQRD